MRAGLAVVFATLLASPASAELFLASNGMLVDAESPRRIVVPMRGRAAALDFWCAAGDYVAAKLNPPPRAVLYRNSEPPRRSGEPIVFSMDPADSASSTGILLLGGPGGGGMSVTMAQSFCETSKALYPE